MKMWLMGQNMKCLESSGMKMWLGRSGWDEIFSTEPKSLNRWDEDVVWKEWVGQNMSKYLESGGLKMCFQGQNRKEWWFGRSGWDGIIFTHKVK